MTCRTSFSEENTKQYKLAILMAILASCDFHFAIHRHLDGIERNGRPIACQTMNDELADPLQLSTPIG